MQNRVSIYFAAFFFLISLASGCNKDGGGGNLAPQSPPENNQPETNNPSSQNGGGTTTGPTIPNVPNGAQLVESDLQLSVIFSDSVSESTQTTYLDIASILENNCVKCHGPAQTSPDLSQFPFKGRSDFAADELTKLVFARMTDESQPMPPSGLLSSETLKPIKLWAEQGFAAAPVSARDETGTYTAEFRWEGVNAHNDSTWRHLELINGKAELNIGKLPVGVALNLTIRIKTGTGTILSEKTWTDEVIPSTGKLKLAMSSLIEDKIAPAPGNQGNLKVERYTGTNLILSWQPATDKRTASEKLSYQLVRSPAPLETMQDLNSEELDFGPVKVNNLREDIQGLLPSEKIYFSVVVIDEAGNKSLYRSLLPVIVDETAPDVTQRVIKATNLTDQSLTLSWTLATDDITQTDKLVYRVVSSTDGNDLNAISDFASASEVSHYSVNKDSVQIKGLLPRTKYRFNVMVRDEKGNVAIYRALDVMSDNPDGSEYTIQEYGRECAERMGVLKPFNCLDLQEIPIEVDGQIPAGGYPAFAENGSGRMDCDKPALLSLGGSGQCPPHSRIGRLKSYRPNGTVNEDVDTVVICRRYNGRDGIYNYRGDNVAAKDFPLFEDVAIIQHNKKSGDTCWYQMLDNTGRDARRVPPPTEVALPANAPSSAITASDFWMSPESAADIRCLRCHDSDPWIHTPYVDQMKLADGSTLVPSNPFREYKNVGRFFSEWTKESKRSFAISTKEKNSCTTCHRIGSQNTCDNFAGQSIGQETTRDLSDYASRTFKLSHWMPPSGHGVETIQDWQNDEAGMRSDADKLLACCSNPDAAECVKKPINSLPAPYTLRD